MLVSKVFSFPAVAGDLGIEIEVEGESLPSGRRLQATNWNSKEDDSLRGESKEYIIKHPINLDEVKFNVDTLNDKFSKSGAVFYDSYRAGVHVHVNVQNLTFRQVVTFLTTYFIFEEVLTEWCGETRVGNHFCLRSTDAYYLIQSLVTTISKNAVYNLASDSLRYSSVNVSSIPKHGSVEFRALESTIDTDRIYNWCKALLILKDWSLKFNDPREVLKSISADGYEIFFNKVFGDIADEFRCEFLHEKIRNGIVSAQDIAYCKDWEKYNLDIFSVPNDYFA